MFSVLISYSPRGDDEATSLLPPSLVWSLGQSSHPQLGCLSHSLLHCFRSGIFGVTFLGCGLVKGTNTLTIPPPPPRSHGIILGMFSQCRWLPGLGAVVEDRISTTQAWMCPSCSQLACFWRVCVLGVCYTCWASCTHLYPASGATALIARVSLKVRGRVF